MRRHRHRVEPLYAVPGVEAAVAWMDYMLRELDRYVVCRSCRRVGWRNSAGAILWYPKAAWAEYQALAYRWQQSLFSLV